MRDHEVGYIYKIDKSEILVSSQPTKLFGSKSSYEAAAYLSVTDSFCSPPEGVIYTWFPWNEGRMPIPEMYYACNRSLGWWVHKQQLPKIQIFCDGGTHRSVTVFGAFLLTYFQKQAQEIVENRTPFGYENDEDKERCNPLLYINSYLDNFPEDRLLFKVMGEDHLSRLDVLCKDIYKTVKDRYGENR